MPTRKGFICFILKISDVIFMRNFIVKKSPRFNRVDHKVNPKGKSKVELRIVQKKHIARAPSDQVWVLQGVLSEFLFKL